MTRVTYFLMGPWVSSSENSKFLRMFDSTTSSSLAANSCPIQFLKWACVEGVMLIYKSIIIYNLGPAENGVKAYL